MVLLVGLALYSLAWLVAIVQIAASDDVGWARRAVFASLIAAHLAVAIWYVGFRYAGAGVLAGPRDVIIRNPGRSVRLDWSEIERFSVDPAGPWTQGYVHTRDGRSIPITGIQGQMSALFPKSRWAEAPVGELNRLLEEARRDDPIGSEMSDPLDTGPDPPNQSRVPRGA